MAREFKKLRNIGIIAHIDAGKTTTTERILYYSGVEHRIGDVDQGNTTTDWMEAEQERGITITSAAVSLDWDGYRINVIDTPGHVDFTAEVERSLRVLDGAVFVFCGVAGVQAQSETVWRQSNKYHVPTIAFINKLDRTGADFERAVESIEKRLGANPIPIQIPHLDTDGLHGIIDLITLQYLTWPGAMDNDDWGRTIERSEIPEAVRDQADEGRAVLIDKLSMVDDEFAEQYLEHEDDIPAELVVAALRRAAIAEKAMPVLCGSSLKNTGVQPLMDAVVSLLPAPGEVSGGTIEGVNPKNDKPESRKLADDDAFSALAFKTFATRNFELTYLRVYSGTLKKGSQVLNSTRNKKERLNQVWLMHAMSKRPLDEIKAGDIVAVTGLQQTYTGDTLCLSNKPIVLEPPSFPHTVVEMSVEAKSSKDKDDLDRTLALIAREDPTFATKINPDSGQLIICGMGELHLEVIRDRMQREFKVECNVGRPSVAYKETIKGPADGKGEYSRTAPSGAEFRAEVTCRISPARDLPGVDASNAATKEQIPLAFHHAITRELKSALENSGGYGYPLIQARVALTGGHHYEGMSTEDAYVAAANAAIRDAVGKAGTQLLEPIMSIVVETPDEYVGDVQRDLSRRRVEISEMFNEHGQTVIKGSVPIAEMFGYTTVLRSATQGRAGFSLEPRTYAPVPPEVEQKFSGF
jgi:elongation factor G